jgi:carboxymethylenebutenolidase
VRTPATVVGFCFGGAQAYLAAASDDLRHDGVIAFYGGLDGSRTGIPSPPDQVDRMRGPILGLFGGADAGIPVERVEEFDAALARAGVEHEIVVYPGAPHSFFDRKYAEYADACDDAWRRVLRFLERAPVP